MPYVSEDALIGRMNSKLFAEGEILRQCSERSRWFNELGRYYTGDIQLKHVYAKHIDLEGLAQELGVLSLQENRTIKK